MTLYWQAYCAVGHYSAMNLQINQVKEARLGTQEKAACSSHVAPHQCFVGDHSTTVQQKQNVAQQPHLKSKKKQVKLILIYFMQPSIYPKHYHFNIFQQKKIRYFLSCFDSTILYLYHKFRGAKIQQTNVAIDYHIRQSRIRE